MNSYDICFCGEIKYISVLVPILVSAVNSSEPSDKQFDQALVIQVTHSRIGHRISHGYDPASFAATRIGP